MLSIVKTLFERKAEDPLQPVVSPTSNRDGYVKQKKEQLRKMLGRPGQDPNMIRQQLKDLEKTKNDVGWGVTKF